MLNQMRQSAGKSRAFSSSACTSETLSNKITTDNLKQVSEHPKKHVKPMNDTEFGYYLAGLIDGDGHFSKSGLAISFHSADYLLAHYIKTRLDYGRISEEKGKNAIRLSFGLDGTKEVITLINNKFRTHHRFEQIEKNLFTKPSFSNFCNNLDLSLDKSENLDNYWLSGFSDADASFQIKILKRSLTRTEVRLNYQVDQKYDYLLKLIQKELGGNIGHRKSQDTYYYGSTSFVNAVKVIKYFDKYHLMSTKLISYLRWRRAYLIIQDRRHLTPKGLEELAELKSSLAKLEEVRKTYSLEND